MLPYNATKLDYGEAKGGPTHKAAAIVMVAVFSSMIVVAIGSILVYYCTSWLDKPLGWIGLGRRARKPTTFYELNHQNNGMAGPCSASYPNHSACRELANSTLTRSAIRLCLPPQLGLSMSLRNAFQALGQADVPKDNNATVSVTQLPANILDAFVPGYPVISKFIRDSFGFDISIVVSLCLLIFGVFTSIKFVWHYAYEYFEEYCTSYICIESDDDIFTHVMDWLAEQKISKSSRTLMATTGRESAWDTFSGGEIDLVSEPGQLLNFSNWDAKVPPTFQPYFGTHRFFHKGRYFEFLRTQKSVMGSSWGGGSVIREDEYIKLVCIGRSTQPIKELIKEARDHYLDKEKTSTVVRRPAPKESRGRGRNVWLRVASRPSRPIATVVLDAQQKSRLLADINEYLHPKTAIWYANRGIPYRRGYLLAGPPGTGKSSLAWAIAGVFGLDIYCISLVEPTLTEEDLGTMFTSLPRRCVVLLEDIDAAGLVKREEPTAIEEAKDTSEAAKLGAEISKAIKASQEKGSKAKEGQGISLSGLLNAIDGVASHEGRVLLMTTNFPERLDDALIRPGRIDMKIAFTKATKSQMTELFIRMYSPDAEVPSPNKAILSEKSLGTATETAKKPRHRHAPSGHELIAKAAQASVPTPPDSPRHSNSSNDELSSPEATELQDIAAAFAKKLPEETFTPAEIQGFLLTRKNDPARALKEVEVWRDQLIAAKEKKDQVGNPQVSQDAGTDEHGNDCGHSKLLGADQDDFCDFKWCKAWSDEETNEAGDVNGEASEGSYGSEVSYDTDDDEDA
ncbi:MAG: hypothetical protein Q9169_002022 [Polycauliona sp. 2 TL-2023]